MNSLIFDDLIKSSINESLKSIKPTKLINENFNVEKNTFKQVSEFLSQKTKEAHQKLYDELVDKFNSVSSRLDTALRNKPDEYESLKKQEINLMNSIWLHQLYFTNCFDPNSEITLDSKSYLSISKVWGTFEDWQKHFMACALSSSGWVVFAYNLYLKNYVNTIITDDDTNVMLGLYPLIVIDLHEHAYVKDYMLDKQSYLVSQLKSINWDIVEKRIEKAKALNNVLGAQ